MPTNTFPILDPHIHQWDQRRTPRKGSPLVKLLGWHPRLMLWAAQRLFPADLYGFFGSGEHVLGDYLPADYRADTGGRDVVGFVHIQAGWEEAGPMGPVGETRWLESLGTPMLSAVVAHADLGLGDDVEAVFAAHADTSPRLRGIRYMLANHPDPGIHSFCEDPNITRDAAWRAGFAKLAEHDDAGPENLGVSDDGVRIAFTATYDESAPSPEHDVIHVLTSGDGGLQVVDSGTWVFATAMSGDGQTFFYEIERGAGSELMSALWGGTPTTVVPGDLGRSTNTRGARLSVATDGSRVFLGDDGRDVSRDGAPRVPFASGWNFTIGFWLNKGTASRGGDRIAYVTGIDGLNQLAVLEIGVSAEGHPSFDRARITPSPITAGGPLAVMEAEVTGGPSLDWGPNVRLRREQDREDSISQGGWDLHDDGASGGDVTAGDGVYTQQYIGTTDTALPAGRRTVRIAGSVGVEGELRTLIAADFEILTLE